MQLELVSIISPVYNGEKYIENYLISVLNQTYPKIELILIDDASSDNTPKIVLRYIPEFEKRGYSLLYKKQKENKGQAAAINVGLKIFSGEYITWMDSDDIYYSDAIEKKVGFLKNNPDVEYVLNEGEIVEAHDLNKQIRKLRRIQPECEDCLFRDLLTENNVVFAPGSILVKSEALMKALPDLTIFESREGQNWQLMLPLAYTCKYGYLKEVLFKYVVHSDSHSHIKRSYERERQRRKNFYILQKNTIEKIVDMNEEEKMYWLEFAYGRMLYSQYVNANRHLKIRESKKIKKLLQERNIDVCWNDRLGIVNILDCLFKIKAML